MTSTINRNVPVAGAQVLAQVIQDNFDAAADDIEALQAEIAAIGGLTSVVVTSAGPITLSSSNRTVFIKQSIGAAITLHLPASLTADCEITVKDAKGDAGTNNITINTTDSTTIDGASSQVISFNYAAMTFYFSVDIGQWSVL